MGKDWVAEEWVRDELWKSEDQGRERGLGWRLMSGSGGSGRKESSGERR